MFDLNADFDGLVGFAVQTTGSLIRLSFSPNSCRKPRSTSWLLVSSGIRIATRADDVSCARMCRPMARPASSSTYDVRQM